MNRFKYRKSRSNVYSCRDEVGWNFHLTYVWRSHSLTIQLWKLKQVALWNIKPCNLAHSKASYRPMSVWNIETFSFQVWGHQGSHLNFWEFGLWTWNFQHIHSWCCVWVLALAFRLFIVPMPKYLQPPYAGSWISGLGSARGHTFDFPCKFSVLE